MLIDWFTVAAQLLNFIVLVWLMKRFLYKPILDAIASREKHIAAALADADAKQAEARQERDDYRRRNDELDEKRAALLDEATADAAREHRRLLDSARAAADALSAKRAQATQADVQRLEQSVVRRVQQEVFAIAGKALQDLASTSLEARAADVFASRLKGLEPVARSRLGEALRVNDARAAVVRSAFALDDAQRQQIQAAVDETFSAGVALRFETAPELVSGIELAANGQKVAWSIADYLASLQAGLADLTAHQPAAVDPADR